MSERYGDYPTHTQVLEYLETYADRFGIRPFVRFRTRVTRVRPLPSGDYDVTWQSLDAKGTHVDQYASVIVASGHHWKPFRPAFPGSFSGREMHSSSYRTPDRFSGRRVLVVGIGNSACDIVCEVSRVADRTLLSTRRRAHVIPKHILGRPLDHWLTPLSARLPFAVRRTLFKVLIFLERGSQQKYGLPPPDHELGAEHPTISSDLLPRIRQGSILPKPNIDELRHNRVAFVDDTEEVVDDIIYATGYLTSFPFLDFIDVEDNELPLYLHVVHPAWPGLYFLGLVQPLGALPPLAEAQAAWVADLIEGSGALPAPSKMKASIRRQEEALRTRYVDSRRHRTEVEVHPYLQALQRERKQARGRRARTAAELADPLHS